MYALRATCKFIFRCVLFLSSSRRFFLIKRETGRVASKITRHEAETTKEHHGKGDLVLYKVFAAQRALCQRDLPT